MRTWLLAAMLSVFWVVAAQETPPPDDDPGQGEIIRKWMTADGAKTWNGKFWKIEKGMLEICVDKPENPVQIPLVQVHADDLAYLLSLENRVVWASFQVARAGYAWDENHQLVPRDRNLRPVEGTIDSIISEEMMLVSDAKGSYVVQISTKGRKTGQPFVAELRPASKDKFDLGDGRQAYLCKACFPITNYKAFRQELRENPRAFFPIMAGKSHAYQTWLAGQRRIEELQENAEKREDVAAERARLRSQEEAAAAKRQEELQDQRRQQKLEEQLKDTQNRLKDLEVALKKQEYRKDNLKRFTAEYNECRTRILDLKKKIGETENRIKELEKQLD